MGNAVYLLVFIALVSHQDMQHALMEKQSVEVVIAEEDCQFIWPESFLEGTKTVLCQLAGGTVQEVLHTCHQNTWHFLGEQLRECR